MDTSKPEEIEKLISKPVGSNTNSTVTFGNQFFYALSTQLSSPLSIIQSNIQLLKKHSDYPVNDFTNETFALTESSIENILGFIESLDFLCQESCLKIRNKLKRISIRFLVKQALEELKYQNLDYLRIKVNISMNNTDIYLDKYLLSRILINLLGNALKFSAGPVELRVNVSDNELHFIVRDTGMGIPKDQINAIFDPFVRGSNVKMISGTGLGMAIVARALECMNGSITVNSEIGKGTVINVIIPNRATRNINLSSESKVLLTNNLIKSHD